MPMLPASHVQSMGESRLSYLVQFAVYTALVLAVVFTLLRWGIWLALILFPAYALAVLICLGLFLALPGECRNWPAASAASSPGRPKMACWRPGLAIALSPIHGASSRCSRR
jgi:hypothetical protein